MAISFNPLNVLSGFNLASINTNFNNIKTALTDGLSRSGNGSNQMEADIDLNSNDLLNVGVVDAKILNIDGEAVQPVDLASALKTSNALSELPLLGLDDEARTNLGLGDSATKNVGTIAGTVAAGDDSRIVKAVVMQDYSNSIMSVPNPPPANGVDDDGPYIDGALIALAGKPIFIPRPLRTSGGHTIPANTTIEGLPSKTTITRIGTANLFTISGNDSGVKNLFIDSAAATAGFDFTIAAGTVTRERIKIENILTFDSLGFLQDTGSGNGIIVSLIVENCQLREHRGRGIYLRRGFAYNTFDHVTVDFNNSSNGNFTGFELNGTDVAGVGPAGGYTIEKCDVAGTAQIGGMGSQNGFILTTVNDVTVVNSLADTCGGYGWLFTNCLNSRGDIKATLCGQAGLELANCSFSNFSAARVRGRNTITGQPFNNNPNIHGVLLSGTGQHNSFGVVDVYEHTGSGLVRTGTATQTTVGNLISTNNTRYGVETVNNQSFVVGSGILANNTINNFNLAGSLDHLRSTMVSSGTMNNFQGPLVG